MDRENSSAESLTKISVYIANCSVKICILMNLGPDSRSMTWGVILGTLSVVA